MKKKPLKVIKPKPSEGWVCTQCGRSFPTMNAMIKHTNEVHVRKSNIKDGKTVEEPNPVDPITPKEKETIEISQPPPAEEIIPQEKTPIINIPIELGYKYIGNCPVCRNDLETLMIEVEVSKKIKKQYAIAFCNVCKKKLKSREVVKL